MAAGALAGLLVLVVDVALGRWMAGYAAPVSWRIAAASAGFGMLVCGLLEILRSVTGRAPGSFLQHATTAAAALYGGSIYERVERLGLDRSTPAVAAVAGVLALLGYGLWILCLARIRRPRADGESRLFAGWQPPALGIGALTVALGLAVNLHLVSAPGEPTALVLDAAIVAVSLGLALAWRAVARGRGRVAVILAGVLVLGFSGLVQALRTPPPRPAAADDTAPPELPRPAATDSPHLVLLTIDTLRKDVFDSVIEQTAEGQALREALGSAAWFDNFIAVAPWTAPAVASILTGLHPHEHGYTSPASARGPAELSRMDGSIRTLAEALRERGYFTAAIVTNPHLTPAGGLAQGFSDYEWLRAPTRRLPAARFLARIGWLVQSTYQPATVVRRRFDRLLKRLPADRPAFLWVHLMDPHLPLHQHRDLPPEPSARAAREGQEGVLDEDVYRQETRFLCRELTRLVELLKERRLWSETLWVMAADHGEMFLRDGHQVRQGDRTLAEGHGHALYSELLRVPAVVRPPGGLPAELRIDALASQVDLYSTIIESLGFEDAAPPADRISWAPSLEPDTPNSARSDVRSRRYVLSGDLMIGPTRNAIRTRRWKLIHSPSGTGPDELYDLDADPGEQRNLAAEEPARREELKALLGTARARLKAPPEARVPVVLDPETQRQLKALGYVQ